MDYALATFDGAHFAHIAVRQEHLRIRGLHRRAVGAIRALSGAGRPQGRFEDI